MAAPYAERGSGKELRCAGVYVRQGAEEGVIHLSTRVAASSGGREASGWGGDGHGAKYVCVLYGQDAAEQGVQGRRGEDRRSQKLPRDRHRVGDRDAEAGRPAGAALASERRRMAVLREGQRPDDSL